LKLATKSKLSPAFCCNEEKENIFILPIVIYQMRAKNHHIKFKELRFRFNAKHDWGKFRIIGTVASGNTNPEFSVIPVLLHDLFFLI
jgi:hypothetical protein